MQKKLIALAITAAFSTSAFADVGMYGVIDAAVGNVSNTGQKSDTQVVSGGMSPSRIGFKASEDLGGGLKAVGNLEYGLDTQTNSTIGATAGSVAFNARQQMVGIAGDFGTVATGYLQTTGYDFGVKFDPLNNSIASPLQNATVGAGLLIGSNAGATRAQRALAYISPNMSGFSAALNYSTALSGLGNVAQPSAGTTGLKTTAVLASVNFEQGPAAAGLVYTGLNNTNAGASNTSEWALGGSYNFDVAKVYATYQSQSNNVGGVTTGASQTAKAYSLSATAPLANGDTVAASYAATKMTAANSNGSGYTLGYLHPLSKMTKLYAAYSHETNGSASNAYSVVNSAVAGGASSLGASSNLFAVGVNYKF